MQEGDLHKYASTRDWQGGMTPTLSGGIISVLAASLLASFRGINNNINKSVQILFAELKTVEIHSWKTKKIRDQVLPPSPYFKFLPLTFCQPLNKSRV